MNVLLGLGFAGFLFVFLFGLGILGLLWRSWWLYPAWTWFLVPLGLPTITFWHFTALTFLVGVFTTHIDTKKDERPTNWPVISVMFVWPVVTWAILRWLKA